MKKWIIALGAIALVAAAGWKILVSPRYEARLNPDWTWNMAFIGVTSYADENGEFQTDSLADDPINLTAREMTITSTGSNNTLDIRDHYATRDPVTNAVTWEVETNQTVDAVTARHVTPEYSDQYFVFPRHVQRGATYALRNSGYYGIPVTFVREENVSGINTFVYEFSSDWDNTAGYPDMTLEAGQSIICFDFQLTYHVEPTTGEIVKYREWCEGDYIVNAAGERLSAISRWGGDVTGAELERRVGEVQGLVLNYQLMTLVVPLVLGILGAVLVVVGLLVGRQKPAPSPEGTIIGEVVRA
jgi:hypothetical protein